MPPLNAGNGALTGGRCACRQGSRAFLARVCTLADDRWARRRLAPRPTRTPPRRPAPRKGALSCALRREASRSAPARPLSTAHDAGASGAAGPVPVRPAGDDRMAWAGAVAPADGRRAGFRAAALLVAFPPGRGGGRRSRLGPPRPAATPALRLGCSTCCALTVPPPASTGLSGLSVPPTPTSGGGLVVFGQAAGG